MYAAETWTYTVVLQKRLDGTYINQLRKTKHSLECACNAAENTWQIESDLNATMPQTSLVCRTLLSCCGRSHLAKLTYQDDVSRDTGIPLDEMGSAKNREEVILGIQSNGGRMVMQHKTQIEGIYETFLSLRSTKQVIHVTV